MKRLIPLIVVLLSLACAFGVETETPAPLPTQPLLPTEIPSAIPATVAPTPITLPTSVPLATATQPPTQTLSSNGPWLLLHTGDQGLWALNPDGSGLTQLVDQKIISPPYRLDAALSPDGHHLAFVTASDPDSYQGLTLNLLTLPDRTVTATVPLFKPEVVPFTGDNFGTSIFEAVRAITDYDSMAWSPNGDYLAYISAFDGPSSDLYVYRLATDNLERLTDGPSQTYKLSWSPDSVYIVHAGVDSFGTGAGYSLTGLWAAPANGTPLKTLNKPGYSDVNIVGWIASNVFLMHSWNAGCGNVNLRFYNLDTNTETGLAPGCIGEVVFDQTSHALAYSTLADEAVGQGNGVYILPPESNQPIRVLDSLGQIQWLPRYSLFKVNQDGNSLYFTPGGAPASLPGPEYPANLAANDPINASVWTGDFQNLALFVNGQLYLATATNFQAQPVPETNQLTVQSIAWLP